MMALWREYEENTTPNALLVHDIDKFEMLLQAYEYERSKHPKSRECNLLVCCPLIHDHRARCSSARVFR